MKPATFTPAYVACYPMLSEIARQNGYALAIHGTVASDMDLIAVPWVSEHTSPFSLVRAFCDYLEAVLDIPDGTGKLLSEPEEKPHGRQAWAIPLGHGSVIDLSVWP